MWIIGVTALMNVVGLLIAGVALAVISREEPRHWLSSRHGRGALSILAAGCLLIAGAQHALIRLLQDAIQHPVVEPPLRPAVIVLGVSAALLTLGGRLLKGSDWTRVAHGGAVVTALVALILVVVGLSPFRDLTQSFTGLARAEQRIVDRFHSLFYYSPQAWRTSTWLGVLTWQNPNDVWIHQEILSEVKPDFIIEAGTAAGGSALLWAMILEQVHPAGKVITIDIRDQIENTKSFARHFSPTVLAELVQRVEEARQLPIWKERIQFLKGSSTDPQIVAEVAKRVKGHRVLVILDSDHRKDHVLAELEAYAPLVTTGSYVIVQDTNVNGHPVYREHGPGPMEAVIEFLASNKEFEADRSRERLLFTMHPNGYLKRIR